MKKVLAIALVLCLVVGAAFAAKGDIKVGGQLGFGFDWTKVHVHTDLGGGASADYTMKVRNSGLYFNATGEYDVTDAIGVKAEIGLMTMGKQSVYERTEITGFPTGEETVTDKNATPMNFTFYLGGQYAFEVSKGINVAAGAGLDIMMGKQDSSDDAKSNTRIGVGIEAVGSYAINKNINVTLGAKYSIYFANTNEDIKKAFKDAKDAGGSVFQSGLKIFAGCTYTL